MNEIKALAKIVFLSGIRKHSIWALCIFAVLIESSGVFFIDFFGRDIGRVTIDFIFTILWGSGMLFILFYAIQTFAWDDEHRMIDTILSKPISRVKYVLGILLGMVLLLLTFETILFMMAFIEIIWIKTSVAEYYFPVFNQLNFIFSAISLQFILIPLLAVAMFSTSIIRGSFPVMLITLSYYFICSGLPVVRSVVESQMELNSSDALNFIKMTQMIFPDFSILDFKSTIVEQTTTLSILNLESLMWVSVYITVVVIGTCLLYKNKDIV